MERTDTICYWWECEEFPAEIPSPLADELEEHATERISEMMKEGYIAGELYDCVHIEIPGHDMPEDGYYCSGRWTVKKNRGIDE